MSGIRHSIKHLPVPTKAVLAVILISGATWFTTDYLASRSINTAFEKQLGAVLEEKAFQHRIRFNNTIELYPQIISLLSIDKQLVKTLESEQDVEPIKVKYHKKLPPWLLDAPLSLTAVPSAWVFLLDSKGRVREVYQKRGRDPHSEILHLSPLALEKSYDQMYIAAFDKVPHLLIAKRILSTSGEMLGSLLFSTHLDEEFMVMSNGPATEWNLVALVDEDTHDVLVSNNLQELPVGTKLSTIEELYVFTKPTLMSLGGMELHFNFVSLVRKDHVHQLTGQVLKEHRLSHIAEAAAHIGPFILIIMWLSQRISRITSRVESFSQHVLANDGHPANTGDQITILEQKFQSLTDDVNTRTAQLETTNRELEAFTYSVSHDLRAPLRGIDGFSKALEEDFGEQLNDEGRDYIQRVRRGAQRIGELIDDLLMLSQVSRSSLNREKINLSNMAQELFSELQEAGPERKVEIVVSPQLLVEADAKLTRLALLNLLSNAWKFTSKEPQARIEVGQLVAEQTDSQPTPGQAVFFVRDNGAGFNMKFADQMFGAFQRLHSKEEFPGTGVGLATVQRVVHRHGGKVWAEGQAGKGATFYFTFGDLS